MGEIIGGIIVMGLFIAFAMWKGKKSTKKTDPLRQHDEDSSSFFSFGAGRSDDDDTGDDGGDD